MKRTLALVATVALVALAIVYIPSIIHETVESPQPGQHYLVALGDSVAEGAGLGSKGNQRPNPCDAMQDAFPFVVGNTLHQPVEQFACSGATIADTGTTNSLLADQLPAAWPFLAGSDVVVNAGANDIGWLQTLTSCATSNCATPQNHAAIATKLHVMQKNMTTLLTKVQQQKPRQLIVNTYYDLFAAGDSCFARLGISPQEVSFIHDEETQLNAAISAAATVSKATIVTIDFSGHTLCSSTSWIQGTSAAAPLHPTATGQQQIATQDTLALKMAH